MDIEQQLTLFWLGRLETNGASVEGWLVDLEIWIVLLFLLAILVDRK